jgi:HSP20 family molecular chaperone IbpA
MDPEKEVEITVEDGTLTIHAERREEHKEPHRSEFRYGSFTRSVVLPGRADTEHVSCGCQMRGHSDGSLQRRLTVETARRPVQ